MANRLADEPSLYLRQHADNPVDWHAWGEEAFSLARESGRPLLLSIGYSSCHWCHVMAHESFEDAEVAAVMNELYVNVKVDREERPDVDSVYMDAVQTMTGQGGWPLTVFLDHDGRPFWGGTYFPKHPRGGMPGFIDVLRGVHATWFEAPDQVEGAAAEVMRHIGVTAGKLPRSLPPWDLVGRAAAVLVRRLEKRWGGFERAPKFPPPMAIELLLRACIHEPSDDAMHAVTLTLDHMLWGGMYDQVGGGFHRYSVDDRWLVPHFEKMLYDNAQLARCYTNAWRVTGVDRYRRAAGETLDFMLRDLRVDGGALGASVDADDPGGEGSFYSWTPGQLKAAVGEVDGEWVAGLYGCSELGNFEGSNVVSLPGGEPTKADWERLVPLRERLREARAGRPAPGIDRKVVAGWNGLAIAALAEAGVALARDDYIGAATDIARHLLDVQTAGGVLHRTWHEGGTLGEAGFCEDYATVGWGLLALYEATFEQRWFDEATRLTDELLERFDDRDGGGFFTTAAAHDELVFRPKDCSDHPLPSGNSMAATVLARLAQWYPERSYRDRAAAAIALVASGIERMPTGLAQAGIALDHLTAPARELVVVAPVADLAGTAPFVDAARASWRPHLVLATGRPDTPHPGFRHRSAVDDNVTAYLCEGMACKAPTASSDELARQLRGPSDADCGGA